MPNTYTINDNAGLPMPVAGARPRPGQGAAQRGRSHAESQRQRKIELAHEASLLNKAGRIHRARGTVSRLCSSSIPSDAQALYNLGVLIYRKDSDKRESGAPSAQGDRKRPRLCRTPTSPWATCISTAGTCFRRIEIYEAGLRQVPTRLQLLNSLLRAAATMRSPQRVEKIARRILNIDDDDANALNYLAWALISWAAAISARRTARLQRALKRAPRRADDASRSPKRLAELAGKREAAAQHHERPRRGRRQKLELRRISPRRRFISVEPARPSGESSANTSRLIPKIRPRTAIWPLH